MEISVVIVSYNTKKLLKECLESLFKKTELEVEVIVVDNASRDDSPEMVKKFFPQVILVKNEKNVGFAAGNNDGIKKTRGDFVLLLNSDTRLVEDSLGRMVEFMKSNPRIGISSCQLVGGDGEIQATGGFFPNLWRVFSWMLFIDDLPFVGNLVTPFHPHPPKFYTHDQWYKSEHYQDWVTGAFFLIRRGVVEDVGLFDENFFMYLEETEYCYRARKKGWQVLYTPVTKIVHLGGRSGNLGEGIIREYQNLKYFFIKHKPGWQVLIVQIFLKIGALLRIVLFGIIKGSPKAREIYVKAFRVI